MMENRAAAKREKKPKQMEAKVFHKIQCATIVRKPRWYYIRFSLFCSGLNREIASPTTQRETAENLYCNNSHTNAWHLFAGLFLYLITVFTNRANNAFS